MVISVYLASCPCFLAGLGQEALSEPLRFSNSNPPGKSPAPFPHKLVDIVQPTAISFPRLGICPSIGKLRALQSSHAVRNRRCGVSIKKARHERCSAQHIPEEADMHNRFSCGPWSGHVQLDGLLLIKEWAPRIQAGPLEGRQEYQRHLEIKPI